MAMRPRNMEGNGGNSKSPIDWAKVSEFENEHFEEGLMLGVIAGIWDLGKQNRDPIKQDDGSYKELKPADQLAIVIDFPEVIIDWDEMYRDDLTEEEESKLKRIGKKPYRMTVNPSFNGKMSGITFSAVPTMEGDTANWDKLTLPGNSVLRKLAMAAEKTILEFGHENHMDILAMLGKPLLVEISEKEGKNGRIYRKMLNFVKAKDRDLKGVDFDVVETSWLDFEDEDSHEALEKISHQVKYKMAQAINCDEGSAIYEALKESGVNMERAKKSFDDSTPKTDEPPKTEAKTEKKPAGKAKTKAAEPTGGDLDDFDDDIPF